MHVDGCVAAAAHTILIDEPGRPTAVPTARQADVVLAAKAAADVAQELLRCRTRLPNGDTGAQDTRGRVAEGGKARHPGRGQDPRGRAREWGRG